MIPESDFHKRRSSIFALVSGRYYNAQESSNITSDYVSLSGVNYPLNPGRTLVEEEQSYIKRNSDVLKKRIAEIKSDIKNGKLMDEKSRELEILRDINFFLTYIAKPDNPDSKTREYRDRIITAVAEENILNGISLFSEIVPNNCAVINGRIYPLREIEQLSFLRVYGKNYTFNASKMTVDDVENAFKGQLEQELIGRVMKGSGRYNEVSDEIMNLRNKNILMAEDLGVKRYPYCYESGDIGFDFSIRRIYCLIKPHSNQSTGRTYSEGESASTLTLENGVIGGDTRFADRNNRNSPFTVNSGSHCLGSLTLQGNTLEHKMQFLRLFAKEVYDNGKFYEPPNTDSSSY